MRTTNAISLLPSSVEPSVVLVRRTLTHRVEDAELSAILETSFKTRLIEIMDQSQHSLADHGGEGAAYEFAQGLDSWEKERELQAVPAWLLRPDLAGSLLPCADAVLHARATPAQSFPPERPLPGRSRLGSMPRARSDDRESTYSTQALPPSPISSHVVFSCSVVDLAQALFSLV